MKIWRFFALLGFLVGCSPLFAFTPGQIFHIKVKEARLPVQVIDVVFEEKSQEALIRAMALRLKDYSRETNFEGCAVVCESKNKNVHWAGVMISAQSHIACPIVPACPRGYAPTAIHIHSHPARQISHMNAVDKALTGADSTFGHDRNLNLPSRADHGLGKGFLVTQRSLIWFENGRHTVVERWE